MEYFLYMPPYLTGIEGPSPNIWRVLNHRGHRNE